MLRKIYKFALACWPDGIGGDNGDNLRPSLVNCNCDKN